MNQYLRAAGFILLVAVLVFSLAACGLIPSQSQPTPTPTPEETKEIVVETPPPSPTPTPTPTPSVPPVAVTTVPMPMPSVSPTVSITESPDPANPSAEPGASPTVSPSPSPSASPSPTPTPYSYDAEFASTILPDSVNIPENAVPGYIAANGVNFRGGPSASAKILGTFDTGKMVSILGTENGWTEIIANGVTGYVKSEYVVKGDYTPGSSVVVAGGDASGIGVVIVPDGPVNGGIVNNNNGTVIPQAEETDFLGILPD